MSAAIAQACGDLYLAHYKCSDAIHKTLGSKARDEFVKLSLVDLPKDASAVERHSFWVLRGALCASLAEAMLEQAGRHLLPMTPAESDALKSLVATARASAAPEMHASH